MKEMSLQSRKELILSLRQKYQVADWKEKSKIIDGFIAITRYDRKYAINLLNSVEIHKLPSNCKRKGKIKYQSEVRKALLVAWHAANEICAKRLVPFLPDLVVSLERYGHLSINANDRAQLLSISTATVERIIKSERSMPNGKGISTTRSGSLLKKQIKIRTFADWNETQPGFLEGDLVAHCGDNVEGSFLHTLVLTDIASAWTEFLPLLCRSSANVVHGIDIIKKLLPFPLLGIDTDNGSEFINYDLLKFCKENSITFTRSRAYKKNDQAHVEEKNGSIIRKLVGYDRYEGMNAWQALVDLYAVLRLYINYFQPSFKLIYKKRDGAKITKKYDKAQTPYQRLMNSEKISHEIKTKLKNEYETLDPCDLLERIKKCQDLFWQHAWIKEKQRVDSISVEHYEACDKNEKNISKKLPANKIDMMEDFKTVELTNRSDDFTNITVKNSVSAKIQNTNKQVVFEKSSPENRKYRYTAKPRNRMSTRNWRTRKDPFEMVWSELNLQLLNNPQKTAKSLLDDLIAEQPEKFNDKLLRTLQRRVAEWRKKQCSEMKKQHLIFSSQKDVGNNYLSLATEM